MADEQGVSKWREARTRDLTGDVFGRWKVVGSAGIKKGCRAWLCECQCDKKTQRVIEGYRLTGNGGNCTRSCGCGVAAGLQSYYETREPTARDLTGETFGRWTVLGLAKVVRARRWWNCECSCESKTRKAVAGGTLMAGTSQSCGCLNTEAMREAIHRKSEQFGATSISDDKLAIIQERFQVSGRLVPIADASGYAISEDGRVFSTYDRGEGFAEIAPYRANTGYFVVDLTVRGRRSVRTVHRMLALAFLPAPTLEQTHTRHLDGNQTNNDLSNLAWGTAKDNSDDAARHGTIPRGEDRHNARLTAARVLEMKTALASGLSIADVARQWGVSFSNARQIAIGRTWKHIVLTSAPELSS